MNLAEMRDELEQRGYSFIVDLPDRANRWINQAYQEVCEAEDWPFCEATTTGTAPLTISDLRQILYVVDSTNDLPLLGSDQRTIQQKDPDLTQTGSPCNFYLTGSTTLAVWPPDTSVSLTVRYLKVPAELDDDADEPIIPERFQELIIDGAVIKALKDTDRLGNAQALKQMWSESLYAMKLSLMDRNRFNQQAILDTSPAWSRNA